MSSMIKLEEALAPNVKAEFINRYEELTNLQQDQIEMGTTVPQLFGSLSKFVANPSTISVETCKRTLDTDETVSACINFINLAMIAAFGEYQHPSPEIQAFVRKALDNMEGSWHFNLDEMFSAEWAGFSVTEKIWQYKKDFCGSPAYIPKRLVTLPPLTIVFSVNRHGEIHEEGIHQYQRYHNTFFNTFAFGLRSGDVDGFRPDLYASVGDFPYPVRISADLSYLTIKIPRRKVIHLTSSLTGQFRNPYGRSVIRPIYKNWVLKDAFLRMWLIGADRKGTPLLTGYAAPNDTVLKQDNSENGNGQAAPMRADLAMAAALKKIHADSALIFPGKKGEIYELDAVQVQGDMNVFPDGVKYFNTAIMRGMLLPPLVMGGGDGAGSFALGNEHHKVFSKVVSGKLKPYKQGILEQLIKPMIMYNFPKSAWEKDGLGDFNNEEFDPEMMERLANVFGNLTEKGYMTPENQEDMDHVRQKMDLPKGRAFQTPTFDGSLQPGQQPQAPGQPQVPGSPIELQTAAPSGNIVQPPKPSKPGEKEEERAAGIPDEYTV